MLAGEITIIAALLLLNAFFALSEMALVSASKPMLKQMAQGGSKRAELAVRLTEDPGRFLSTVQVGITLVGIVAGAYGGTTIAEHLAPGFNEIPFIYPHGTAVAFTIVVGIITYFSVVIGELIPKQFALRRPEQITLFVVRPMYILSVICSPLVRLLDFSADIFGRPFGLRRGEENQVTEAEVKAVIAEGAEQGAINRVEHEMLQRIIRLGDRDAKSVMTHRLDVTFIDVNDTPEVIREKIHEHGHSRYPVIDADNNKVIGLVQAKDLLDSKLHDDKLDVASVLLEAPVVPDTTSCLKLLDMFKTGANHMIVVLDEYGATEGIVTISDLMEAIVGVIPSNYDDGEHAQITVRSDGSWLADGKTLMDELSLTPGLENVPTDKSYDTIAGFLLYSLNRTPHEGDVVENSGYRFEVVDMDGKRVDKVLIIKFLNYSEGI